jgi:hypothetical protein
MVGIIDYTSCSSLISKHQLLIDSGHLPKTWRKSLPSQGIHCLEKAEGLGQTTAKHTSKEVSESN